MDVSQMKIVNVFVCVCVCVCVTEDWTYDLMYAKQVLYHSVYLQVL